MNHKLLLIAVLLISAFRVDFTVASERPNILIIVSDDQGYADVGFQGCTDIPTPHLDRLAKDGALCTSGYASHPFCSPTRAGLLTGRYQHRFGHVRNPVYNPDDRREGLPLTEKLLPEHLTAAGYKTGWVGKWHLGAAEEFRPFNRGFAETFGFIGGGHKYRDWKVDPKVEYLVPIERNGKAIEIDEHLTTALGQEAASFVTRHKGEPWFLYVAFNSPHGPNEPTDERLKRFSSIENPMRRKYAAQVSLMDDAIGETLEALRTSGQEKNTLVFFFSDNGGPSGNGSQNSPLRDGKGSLHEGGVRVPFVVSWPAQIKPGRYDRPVISLDVMATSLAAAGVKMPDDRKYDSVNLIPYLNGENSAAPHETLFWHSGNRAVRSGDWKLVKSGADSFALYDLTSDIREQTNIAAQHPEVVERLSSALTVWEKEMVPPAFPGASAKKPKANQAK